MPTYEYQCKTCGATMDVFQSIKARPLAKSHCGSCNTVRPVRRLIGTGGAVLFKGSGFYQTDYRSESYQQKAKSETETKSPAADSKSPAPESNSNNRPPTHAPSKKGDSGKTSKKKE